MNVEQFFQHWGISENPFMAEEARDDPVYQRIMNQDMTHPDFDKIYGSPDHPGTAVVFGEKGSGKTAIRLLIEERLQKYNEDHPEQKVWIARYDDLNAMIDNIARRSGQSDTREALKTINLADHMDALLSLVVTRVMDFLHGEDLDVDKPRKRRRQLRRIDYQKRLDLAVLAMLYDQRKTGNPMSRWNHTLTRLRVGRIVNIRSTYWMALIVLLAGIAAMAGGLLYEPWKWRLLIGGGIGAVLGLGGLYLWSRQAIRARKLAKQIEKETRAIERMPGQLKRQMGDLPLGELEPMPLPVPGNEDSRYELFTRLRHVLEALDYRSMVVLMDRVDEPALVNGEPGKMRSIIWPMLNNKFLQLDGVGFKLLLPIELGHLLRREDEYFFQKARLDKQSMIDRLEWSGSTLYDVCTRRLIGCTGGEAKIAKLTDLFEADVTPQDIIEALDQMKQPRDAFKYLYHVVQEHCQNTPHDNPKWHISKAVLDYVRKQESQRVQDLYRGLAPA
jgi:hypothetical protein